MRSCSIPQPSLRRRTAAGAGLALMLTLGACGSPAIDPAGEPQAAGIEVAPETPIDVDLPGDRDPAPGSQLNPVAGDWVVDTIIINGEETTNTNERMRFTITGTDFSGFDGCNGLSGDVSYDIDAGTFAVGEVIQTLIGCDPIINDTLFHQALQAATSFVSEPGVLVLTDGADTSMRLVIDTGDVSPEEPEIVPEETEPTIPDEIEVDPKTTQPPIIDPAPIGPDASDINDVEGTWYLESMTYEGEPIELDLTDIPSISIDDGQLSATSVCPSLSGTVEAAPAEAEADSLELPDEDDPFAGCGTGIGRVLAASLAEVTSYAGEPGFRMALFNDTGTHLRFFADEERAAQQPGGPECGTGLLHGDLSMTVMTWA